MLRKLLICGLLAGLCGGLLATGFASLVGEPVLDRAIGLERSEPAAAPAHGHEAEAAPVSRGAQKSAGLLTAAIVYGLALGGIFALVFAAAYRRVSRAGPRATAYGLATAAFAVVFLVPFLKYPASPPGATDPDTIGRRTALYAAMLAISVAAAALAAWLLRPALERRAGGHAANLGAGLAYLAVVVAAGLALPAVDETPAGFPGSTLWSFRLASVGMQAVLWLAIGLVFAATAVRAMAGQPILPRRVPGRAAPAGGRE